MKIFIINLEHQIEKRQFMQEQLGRLGLEAEFIPAVYGKSMSIDELKTIVHDYENCFLTAGEVGCALSHIKIYKKMVDCDIDMSVVLEDDAIISPELYKIIINIKKSLPSKPMCCLLTKPEVYNQACIASFGGYSLHQMLRGYGTYGYIINLQAAQNLQDNLIPIKSEADRWEFFSRLGFLKTYCLTPPLVLNGDLDDSFSTLAHDREPLIQSRIAYYKKLINQEIPTLLKIKWNFWRLFKRPFIKKVKL